MTRLRRPLALLVVLLCGGGLAACGDHPDKHARVVTAETEGLYLDVGPLNYQVQDSRQLNPYDTQDRNYLLGVPADERQLAANEVWFGVFLRVQNETDTAQRPSDDLEIVDTQDDVFKPIPLATDNVFAYRPEDPIPANDTLPLRDTPGYDTPVRGQLVLFKLTLDSLGNRPLELRIEDHITPQTGKIDLDV